jgi:hypothetical protein
MMSKRVLSMSERHDIRERFLKVDTANVADVLDHMGMLDQGLAATFSRFPPHAANWPVGIIRSAARCFL